MTLRERVARQPPTASLAMPLRGLADMAARPFRPARLRQVDVPMVAYE
jgi:hypothetical protein